MVLLPSHIWRQFCLLQTEVVIVGIVTGIPWVKIRDAVKYPKRNRIAPHNRNIQLLMSVNCAEAEKPGLTSIFPAICV